MPPNEYEMLAAQMSKGFDATHSRIDALRKDFKTEKEKTEDRNNGLSTRIGEVEKQQEIQDALNKQEEKTEGKKWDIWKIVIRFSMAASIPLLVYIATKP